MNTSSTAPTKDNPEDHDMLPAAEEKLHKYPFHEFMVDFLGGLVPGTLFLVGSIVVLVPSFHLLYRLSLGNRPNSIIEPLAFILDKAQKTPNTIWIGIFAFVIGVSYVLGHLFYRRTPKKPDQKSFSKLKDSILERKPEEVDADEYLKTELACTDETNCEFPYPNLREYLGQRGLCHLCPFVLWKADGKEQSEKLKLYRSKTYMNLLKIRLKYYYPAKCSSIIRNEAHVRLTSSTWYVTHALCNCCFIGTAVIVGSVLFYIGVYYNETGLNAFIQTIVGFISFLAPPILVYFTSLYMRDRIEKFIHYQRLREVYYVLETAYTAFSKKPHLLKPPFFEFDTNFSKEICQHKCKFREVKKQAINTRAG